MGDTYNSATEAEADAWLHEPKLDGYRLQVLKEGHRIKLHSRRVVGHFEFGRS